MSKASTQNTVKHWILWKKPTLFHQYCTFTNMLQFKLCPCVLSHVFSKYTTLPICLLLDMSLKKNTVILLRSAKQHHDSDIRGTNCRISYQNWKMKLPKPALHWLNLEYMLRDLSAKSPGAFLLIDKTTIYWCCNLYIYLYVFFLVKKHVLLYLP